MIRKIIWLVVFCGLSACTTSPAAPKQNATTRDEWLAPLGVHRGPEGTTIERAQAITVPPANRQLAISMLSKKSFISLTDVQVAKLLGMSVTPDSVVANVIAAYDAEAARLSSVRGYAEESRQAALDVRNRVWKLKPYLVRGVLQREETGSFSVSFKQNGELWVEHGSLGRSYVPPAKAPVVVYLEQTPSSVFVTTSMAE